MKMKFSVAQILQVVTAALFLVGAIFMLVNTFADELWAFWTGLAFAVVAAAGYILLMIENRKRIFEKLRNSSYSDKGPNSIGHEKNQTAPAENSAAQEGPKSTKDPK
jgi:protein-S-isoprenylcysteine O-methyltransferase Ste14